MGWDYGFAKHYKKGKIDRKACCDERLNWENSTQKVSVVRSSMVGSVYYAAVRIERENRTDIIGAVIKTRLSGREIGMNISEDSVGPTEYKCPISILDLLTPTDSDWANEWRNKCRAYHEDKKRTRNDKYSLKNLPEGSVISFLLHHDNSAYKAGQLITLTKRLVSSRLVWDRKKQEHVWKPCIKWTDGYYIWPEKQIPDDYKVLLEDTIIDKQSRQMIYEGKWTT